VKKTEAISEKTKTDTGTRRRGDAVKKTEAISEKTKTDTGTRRRGDAAKETEEGRTSPEGCGACFARARGNWQKDNGLDVSGQII
jgi:hypothetical protein